MFGKYTYFQLNCKYGDFGIFIDDVEPYKSRKSPKVFMLYHMPPHHLRIDYMTKFSKTFRLFDITLGK